MRQALRLILLVALWLSLPAGFCSAQYTLTESELTTLETNLTQLEKNNAQLTTLYERSQAYLQTAQTRCKDLQTQGMWSEGLGTPVMSAQEVMAVIRSFGMGKFAGAVMFVINEVFGGGNENDNENENGQRRTRRETYGGPQADFVGKRESSEFKRNLNGGPQADGGGERQLENNKYPQMSQMDTDKEPVARIIND